MLQLTLSSTDGLGGEERFSCHGSLTLRLKLAEWSSLNETVASYCTQHMRGISAGR